MTDSTKPKRSPGRPKKAAQLVLQDQHAPEGDPRAFLLAVMNDGMADAKVRIDAAKALMPYFCARVGEPSKKQQRMQDAMTAQRGTEWAGLLEQ